MTSTNTEATCSKEKLFPFMRKVHNFYKTLQERNDIQKEENDRFREEIVKIEGKLSHAESISCKDDRALLQEEFEKLESLMTMSLEAFVLSKPYSSLKPDRPEWFAPEDIEDALSDGIKLLSQDSEIERDDFISDDALEEFKSAARERLDLVARHDELSVEYTGLYWRLSCIRIALSAKSPFEVMDGLEQRTYNEEDARRDDDVCSVCLAPRASGELIVVLRCSHKLHYDCAFRLVDSVHLCCPLCKSSL